MPVQTQFKPGDTIGNRYRVLRSTAGGLGEVYICICLTPGQQNIFALKTLQTSFHSNTDVINSFRREIDVWVSLGKHANIVQCYHLEIIDNRPYIALEPVLGAAQYGPNLRSAIKNRVITAQDALKFGIHVCQGLVYAAEQVSGVVHRDIKPDNILITFDGTAKITDFGLAKIIQDSHSELLTPERISVKEPHLSNMGGTPLYMAPEQWRGEELDQRTDLYALGCVLYEMLTNEMAYTGSTFTEIREKHLNAPVPQLQADSSLNIMINPVIRKCMAKRRDERFSSASELFDELLNIYKDSYSTAPPTIFSLSKEQLSSAETANIGKTFHDLGQYEKALDYLTRSLEIDPANYNAYTLRGGVLFDLGRYEEALEDHKKSVEIKPDHVDAIINCGVTCGAMGQNVVAEEYWERAEKIAPSHRFLFQAKGVYYRKLGEFEKAINCFERVLAADPHYVLGLLARAATFHDMQEYDLAMKDLDLACELHPAFDKFYARLYFQRALTLISLEQLTEALESLNEIVGSYYETAEAYVWRAHVYRCLKQEDNAIKDLRNAISVDPEYALAYVRIARLYLDMGLIDLAAEQIQKLQNISYKSSEYPAVRLEFDALLKRKQRFEDVNARILREPEEAQLYYERGMIHKEWGEESKSRDDLLTAVRLDNKSLDALYQIAIFYFNNREYETARRYLDELKKLGDSRAKDLLMVFELVTKGKIKLAGTEAPELDNDEELKELCDQVNAHPNDDRVYRRRAEKYQSLNCPEKALADMNTAIALRPYHVSHFLYRSSILDARKDYNSALADLKYALLLAPAGVEIYERLSHLYLGRGRGVEAVVAISQAINFDDENPSLYRTRAMLAAHFGNKDMAIEDYSKAIELDPTNAADYLARARQLLKKGHTAGVVSLGQREYWSRALADFKTAVELGAKLGDDDQLRMQLALKVVEGNSQNVGNSVGQRMGVSVGSRRQLAETPSRRRGRRTRIGCLGALLFIILVSFLPPIVALMVTIVLGFVYAQVINNSL